jgi:hypothetical protein
MIAITTSSSTIVNPVRRRQRNRLNVAVQILKGYFILRQFRRQRELATSREKILTYFESRTETQFAGAAAHRLRAADISTAMRAAGHAVNPSSEQ